MKVSVITARHEWPEKAGFCLDRPRGTPYYIFIHFKTPVTFTFFGREMQLQPGACVMIPPNTASMIKSECPLIHDWMHLSADLDGLLYYHGLSCEKEYYVKDSAYVSRIVQTVEKELYSNMPFKYDIIDMKLRELFIHISRESMKKETGEEIGAEVYSAFRALRIETFANIGENFDIAEMARRVHLSESRFYVLYKRIFGISPKNDLIIARIERAKNLLEENKYTNAEIASAVGYTNEYHFIRQFKKHEGITPKEYARVKLSIR